MADVTVANTIHSHDPRVPLGPLYLSSFLEAHGFGLESFIPHPLEIEDGYATAPDRPGHGVVFDWQALERHRAI